MVVVVVGFNPCFVVPFKTVFAFAFGFPFFGFAFGFTVFAFGLAFTFGFIFAFGCTFPFTLGRGAGCREAKRRLFACGSS